MGFNSGFKGLTQNISHATVTFWRLNTLGEKLYLSNFVFCLWFGGGLMRLIKKETDRPTFDFSKRNSAACNEILKILFWKVRGHCAGSDNQRQRKKKVEGQRTEQTVFVVSSHFQLLAQKYTLSTVFARMAWLMNLTVSIFTIARLPECSSTKNRWRTK